MKFPALTVAFGCLALLGSCQKSPSRAADFVISGGPIYTGASEVPVEAVAVTHGQVTGVGSIAEIEPLVGAHTERIDLAGAAMFPGFTDAHAHLLGIGMRELTLNLEGVGSVAELVEIVARETSKLAPGDVLYGRGWIETGWPENRFPNRDDLDPVAPNNPVVLFRADGHAAVVNSAALAAANIDEAAKDPEGGRIERDAAGRPTGMLIDNAMGLVSSLVPKPDKARRREALKVGSEVYARYGWTGLHNMSVDPADVPLIEALADAGDIQIRVYNAIDPDGLDALAASGPRKNKDGRVVTRAVKLYMDGALGSRGAALLDPYSDRPDTNGLLLMTGEEADAYFAKASKAGLQVCVHAIGDRGNRLTLDGFEKAFGGVDDKDRRWRVEHAQVLSLADIPRFAKLKVIASMQPSHAIGDLFFAPARLGPERLNGAYAWRSLLDTGAVVAAGSDAPVERGDPAIEFYAAVARRSLDGFQGADWHAEEAVSRAEALRMLTAAPAYASFQDQALGVIEVGREADFTAFDIDLMTAPESDLPKAKAVLTVVAGKVAYRAPSGAADSNR